MEQEVGLELKNVVDDFAAAELLIAKDRASPLFLCTQTDTMFFITAHLKGYMRKNIKIDINHDGSRIRICGEKPVQELVMAGWRVVKKQVVMRGFKKIFKIPSGVILDKIKARFNEDESVLTISIPKLVQGVIGVAVEELKEDEEMPRGETKSLPVVADGDNISEDVRVQQEEYSKPISDKVQEIDQIMQDLPKQTPRKLEREEVQKLALTKVEIVGLNGSDPRKHEEQNGHDVREDIEKESKEMEITAATRAKLQNIALRLEKEFQEKGTQTDQAKEFQEKGTQTDQAKEFQEKGTQTDQEITRYNQEQEKRGNDQVEPMSQTKPSDVRTKMSIQEQKEADDDEPYTEERGTEIQDQSSDKGRQRKSKKICAPVIIVGSSVLVTLAVLAIHLIRSNNQTRKKKN